MFKADKDNYFRQSNYNWVVAPRNKPAEDLIRSQFQSRAEFTDQRSSLFKLLKAESFESL